MSLMSFVLPVRQVTHFMTHPRKYNPDERIASLNRHMKLVLSTMSISPQPVHVSPYGVSRLSTSGHAAILPNTVVDPSVRTDQTSLLRRLLRSGSEGVPFVSLTLFLQKVQKDASAMRTD